MKLITFIQAAAHRILIEAARPATRRRNQPSTTAASLMGFLPPRQMPGHPEPPKYGTKALVGQFVKRYTRAGHLPPGRVSKGARKRYDHEHGTEGRQDFSEVINARR
jgi:hypothetical protein